MFMKQTTKPLMWWMGILGLIGSVASMAAPPQVDTSRAMRLFDGRTLHGWEGSQNLWRAESGAILGGSLTETVRQNEFLCTTRSFTNFVLRLEFKLTGADGFINSGIQIRSQRAPGSNEVVGYQCDLGDPDWWGAIYDEGRRNRVLFPTDMIALEPVLRRGDWNTYVIRADGPRLTTWINGVQTADYYEDDPTVADHGVIGIQVHGGGKTLIQIKEIVIEELPPTRAQDRFVGAPEPGRAAKESPLRPEEEKAAFSLPPGFEVELVASEEQGVNKPITVVWDSAGRMWTMTAVEYPVDANDHVETAAALYRQPRRDRVLVFDDASGAGPHTPRVFADGLAIPLGLLPYKDGVFVQHGAEIVHLRDTDRDGRADTREVILSGFGIGDSHLMPHQFTRAPGNWILVAQGAFNYSNVRTRSGEVIEFNRTLLGRFRPDGTKFETIGWGPCNIWGLVLSGAGEVFIQEANDYGYPVMPFQVGGFYPGCTPAPKPYAPPYPGLSRIGLGGTGLSGLALSDERGAFPAAYAGVFYVANPVTQRIQAIKLIRNGPHYSLIKMPDFMRSSDEWFRPVAIHFGPDGCLYVVDWYNKIISHNEVPRNHPDRDRSRGRIWRVRHQTQNRIGPTRFTNAELLGQLGSDSLARSHLAWQEIIDRGAVELADPLLATAGDSQAAPAKRVQALWALEGLGRVTPKLLERLLPDANGNLRREAVRAFGAMNGVANEFLSAVERLADDPDPEVRAEVIRSTVRWVADDERAIALLARMAKGPLATPLARSTHNARPIKVREAYDRDFERYLIRAGLEKFPKESQAFLESARAGELPLENRLLIALAMEPRSSAGWIARMLPNLKRVPEEEELMRLAQALDEPGVELALEQVLENPVTRQGAAEALLRGRTRLDTGRLVPLMSRAALALLHGDDSARDLALRLIAGFQLRSVEPELASILERTQDVPGQAALIRALRELGSARIDLFSELALRGADSGVREEAVLALASASERGGPKRLVTLWPELNRSQQRIALDRLAASKLGARELVSAVQRQIVLPADVEEPVLEKMLAALEGDPELNQFLEQMGSTASPVLRLDGRNDSYVDSDITLSGPFTVETWIRLDPGIGNEDGILGRPGGADFNFFDGRLRVYGGPNHGDRIVSKRKLTAEVWTHVAVTRDRAGRFSIYIDGELDNAESQGFSEDLTELDIGRTSPEQGTAALLTEFRVWKRCRTPEEIRSDFDRSFEGETPPEDLRYVGGGSAWGRLNGTARVSRTIDRPPLLTPEEARTQAVKFAKFKELALRTGDAARGKRVAAICLTCHSIQGEGGNIGPNLSGASAMSLDALLRSLLTPNAAVEAGYRIFRIKLLDDDLIDGFFVSQDADSFVVRVPGMGDRRIPKREARRASFIRRSLMPEGLLEGMGETDVADLFTYLRSF